MSNKLAEMADFKDSLNKAFSLAFFIHNSKETALRIATDAVAKLEVAASTQGKRLYYRPARHHPRRETAAGVSRTKVSFGELHLLQRLIYAESERYEKEQEQAGAVGVLDQEKLLIHFIKHLVRITIKRNSFYVALGLSRLLHDYTTSETMEIYNVVVQDPERVKDDYYYRSRKGVLMQELKERFGEFLKMSRGPHGEVRFQAEPRPRRFAELIGECLSVFTPWGTPCLVPAGYNPVTDNIPSLSGGGNQEDQTELNRIHALLHPDCYQRLIYALGLLSPAERLEIPHFFLSHEHVDRQGGERNRSQFSSLSADEVEDIKSSLGELAERRKRVSAGLLRVLVDGVECARLNLLRERHVQFNLSAESEVVEIRTSDRNGDLLLATHLLFHDDLDAARSSRASLVLEGGQKLSIVVAPSKDASGVVVDVVYRETTLTRTISLSSQRMLTALSTARRPIAADQFLPQTGGGAKVPILALSLLLAITGAAGILIYKQTTRSRPEQPIRVNADQTETPAAAKGYAPPEDAVSAGATTEAGASRPEAQTARKQSAERVAQTTPSSAPQIIDPNKRSETETRSKVSPRRAATRTQDTATRKDLSAEETTRSISRAEPASLLDARRIYVEVLGDDPAHLGVRQKLIEELQARDRFVLSETRNDADALLKVTVQQGRSPRNGSDGRRKSTFIVQLINAAGEVIYPLKGQSSGARYSELPIDELGARIIHDLLEEIDELERRR